MGRIFSEFRINVSERGANLLVHFLIGSLYEYYQAFYEYFNLAVIKRLPLSIFESAEFRAVSQFDITTSARRKTEVIRKLAQLVEIRVLK